MSCSVGGVSTMLYFLTAGSSAIVSSLAALRTICLPARERSGTKTLTSPWISALQARRMPGPSSGLMCFFSVSVSGERCAMPDSMLSFSK